MSEGLRANSVFATFGVKTDEWTKGLSKMVDRTAKTLKQIEGIGSKLGGLGAVWGASLGAAIAVASESSPELKSSLDEIKNAGLDLATEIGAQFLPMMQAVASTVRDATTFFQSLNPEIKAGAAQVAGYGTAALLAAGALGKFAGYGAAALEGMKVAASGLTSAFRVLGLMVGGISLPVLAVIAVIGVLVLAAGAVYKAWNDSSSGFKETVMSMLDTVMGWGRAIGDFFVGIWEGIKGFVFKVIDFMLANVANSIRGIATLLKPLVPLLEKAGMGGIADALRSAQNVTGDDLMKGLKKGGELVWNGVKIGANYLVDKAVVAGTAVADGIMYGVDGLKMAAADAAAKLKGAFPNLGGGSASVQRKGEAGDDKAEKSADKNADFWKNFQTKDYGPSSVASKAPSGSGLDLGAQKHKGAGLTAAIEAEKSLTNSFADAAKNVGKALGAAAQTFMNKIGAAGQVANAAIQGAQSGGIWGAVIAAIMELFSMFSGFQELVDILNNSLASHIEVLSDAFRTIVDAIKPLLGAVSFVINVVLQLLTPILEAVAGIFESLAPLIWMIGMLLMGLQPVFDMLGKVIEGVIWLLDKIIWSTFQSLKYTGLFILGIVKAFGDAWNGIVSAIQWVFKEIAKLDIAGWKPLEFLGDWADGLESAKFNMDGVNGAMETLNGTTWEGAMAQAANNAATLEAAKTTEKLNEALSNVPSGIKVASLRFNSSDPVGGSPSSYPTLASGRNELVDNSQTTINITVNDGDADEIIAKVERHFAKKAHRLTGSQYSFLR